MVITLVSNQNNTTHQSDSSIGYDFRMKFVLHIYQPQIAIKLYDFSISLEWPI